MKLVTKRNDKIAGQYGPVKIEQSVITDERGTELLFIDIVSRRIDNAGTVLVEYKANPVGGVYFDDIASGSVEYRGD